MEKKIEKIVETPMSTDVIKKYIEKRNMNLVFLYDTNKLKNLNELFKGKEYIILFVAISSKFDGHYVSMVKDDFQKVIYYFDSYGKPLTFLLNNFKGGNGYDYVQSKNILKLIEKSQYKFIENTIDYQEYGRDVATCGRLSLMFLIMYRIITKHYKMSFTFDLMKSLMTILCQKKNMNYDSIASFFINKLN